MANRGKRESDDFRRIFTAGIAIAASLNDRTRGDVQQDIAQLLGVSKKTVESYQAKGSVLEEDELEIIMRYFIDEVGEDFIGYNWAFHFFEAAHSRYVDGHLSQLFPESQEKRDALTPLPNNLPQQEYMKYIDRSEVEAGISDALAGETPIVFIDGFSGNGKTSCVYKYAKDIVQRRATTDSALVVWIGDRQDISRRAKSRSTAYRLYEKVLKTRGQENVSSMGPSEISESAIRILRQTRALIILDGFENIDDPEIIQFLTNRLPLGCKVIITSQKSISSYPGLERCATVKVPGMKRVEVEQLLLDSSEQDQLLPKPPMTSELLDRIMAITQGNPFAAKSIYGMLRAEMSVGYDPIDALDEFETSNEGLGDGLHDASLSRTWTLLSRDAQGFLELCSLLPKGISDAAVVTIENWGRNDAVKAISACRDANMVDIIQSSDESRSVKVRYALHPLVRRFVTSVTDARDLSEWQEKLVDYYIEDTREVGFCYNNIEALYRYDREGEFEALQYVLNYCEDHDLPGKYFELSENTKYYYYIRGIWSPGEQSVHIKRAYAAKACGNVAGEFDSIVYHINCAAKRQEIDEARKYIEVANELLRVCDDTVPERSINKFNHARALVEYSDGRYREALEIWNENIADHEHAMDEHDLNANMRWRAKCLFGLGDQAHVEQAVSTLEELARSAKAINFVRGYIDANLALGAYYCQTSNRYDAEKIVAEIKDAVIGSRDKKYLAEYHVLTARIANQACDEAQTVESLRRAFNYLIEAKQNQRIVEVLAEFHDYAYLLVRG